jgi:hypothetical protein
VQDRRGEPLANDGPFAKTKEQVAGLEVIECADLDEAVEVPSRHPSTRTGRVEVRRGVRRRDRRVRRSLRATEVQVVDVLAWGWAANRSSSYGQPRAKRRGALIQAMTAHLGRGEPTAVVLFARPVEAPAVRDRLAQDCRLMSPAGPSWLSVHVNTDDQRLVICSISGG